MSINDMQQLSVGRVVLTKATRRQEWTIVLHNQATDRMLGSHVWSQDRIVSTVEMPEA